MTWRGLAAHAGRFLEAGQFERTKAVAHATLGVIVIGFAVYNRCAHGHRPDHPNHLKWAARAYVAWGICEILAARAHGKQ